MQPWLFILITVPVSAFIAGITNHLAIKMLFYPRQQWHWLGGRRVPLTPGVIPRRKNQIAESLGDVVSEYLVTADGVRGLLESEGFKKGIVDRALLFTEGIVQREEKISARDLLLRAGTEEQLNTYTSAVLAWARMQLKQGVTHIWTEKGLGDKKLSEVIPGWGDEKLDQLSYQASGMLLESLENELTSLEGQRLMRSMASGLLERASGFLGALAGMFVDEDKLVQRLTPLLVEQLRSDKLRLSASGMVRGLLNKAGEWTLEEAVSQLSGEAATAEAWLQQQVDTSVPLEAWLDRLLDYDLTALLVQHRQRWESIAGGAVGVILSLTARHVDRIMAVMELPRLVREQVEEFPVERLEQVVLSVSGKEFRMITWFGALLGAVLGLVQSVFVLLFL